MALEGGHTPAGPDYRAADPPVALAYAISFVKVAA